MDTGNTAWMITASVLVILMTVPGLALFYGGLVRTKNMLSVLMQVFVTFSLLSVLWALYAYSLAFKEGSFNAIVGGFSHAFLAGIKPDTLQRGHPRVRVHGRSSSPSRPSPRPDHRRLRGAHQVLRSAVVHGAVVHLRRTRRSRTWCGAAAGSADAGRQGLRRRHGGARQRGYRRLGRPAWCSASASATARRPCRRTA